MIYHFSLYLKSYSSFFNIIHYVSVRAVGGLLTALILSFMFGNLFISYAQKLFRAQSRPFTPQGHRAKDNLPTMGGIFILAVVILSTVLWCDLKDAQVLSFLVCLGGFGLIGAWDDWYKITHKSGVSARLKFAQQIIVASMVVGIWIFYTKTPTSVTIPFFKDIQPDIGWFFALWAVFIIVAASNAVNLTDGLDGLAIGSLLPNFAVFSLICYMAGHTIIASYLHIPFADTSEIAIIGSILIGASLGFLWYNTYPAQIFMGDVGSLALGAGWALMGLMAKQELLLPIAGGLFVAEAFSVILQVGSFRLRGKKIFKMAPFHHHFELLGWPEAKITIRLGIITMILCLCALITLKIR